MRIIAYVGVRRLFDRYAILKKKGVSVKQIWNEYLQVEGVKAAACFFVYCFHSDFSEGVDGCGNAVIRESLNALRSIWALVEMEKHRGVLIAHGLPTGMSRECGKELNRCLGRVRKEALPLVEAFEEDERALNSVLGRKDGEIYEEMIRHAKSLNPVNKEVVFPAIRQFMRPKL